MSHPHVFRLTPFESIGAAFLAATLLCSPAFIGATENEEADSDTTPPPPTQLTTFLMDVSDEASDSEEEANAGAEGADDGPVAEEPFEVIQSSLIVLDPNALDAINPHVVTDVEQMPIVRMELMSDLVIDVEFLNAKPRWTFAAAESENNEDEAGGTGIEPVEDGFLIRGTILPPHSGYVVLRAGDGGVFGAVNVYGVGKFELWRDTEPFHTANLLAYPPAGTGMAENLADEAMGMMGGGTLAGDGCGGYCDGDCPTECAGGCDDGCTMDVLMLYTSAADEFYSNINILMDTRIGEANSILVDSGIMPRSENLLRIVYGGELQDYDESEIPASQLMSELFSSEAVENLRNALRADLVSLWIDPLTPTSWGGIAKRPSVLSLAAERLAYSVVRNHNAGTMTHEFGHNFGCRHDRFQDCGCSNCGDACGGESCGSCDAIYDFAFGLHFSIPGGSAQSLMAYRTSLSGVSCFENADEPWLFSSPDVYYPDEQSGTPTGESGCADNALVIGGDECHYGTRFLVAQHRTSHDTTNTTTMVRPVIDEPPDFNKVVLDHDSDSPSISSNGRYVLFSSRSENVPGGYSYPNPYEQHIYLYDRETSIVTLETYDRTNPGTAADDESFHPAISGNATLLTFASYATNLGSSPIDPERHIWMRQRGGLGGASLISRASGEQGAVGDGPSDHPAVSHDGQFVAFQSEATNLVADDNNDATDVFVRDRGPNDTFRVSIHTNGSEGNGDSENPAISADGVYVVFASVATNLVDNDSNAYRDIFIHNTITGETERVSVPHVGYNDSESNGDSFAPSISADGNRIAFHSDATNLVDPCITIHSGHSNENSEKPRNLCRACR